MQTFGDFLGYNPHTHILVPRTDAQYLEPEGRVGYTAKDKKTSRVFPAMECLAAMCSHIPNRGEQMVRYCGYYSNVSRGKRQKQGSGEAIPCILEPEGG